ncbi:MAG: hypothetical protein WBN66_07480 [Smithella sp.]
MFPPIMGATINSVFLSPEFRIILYLLIAVILIFGTLFFIKKKFSPSDAFRKAVLTAFFVSGLLYAVHADIGWITWLVTDIRNYWGLSTEGKLSKMNDGLYEFVLQAKKTVDDDYQIYSSFEYAEKRTQYYLLPLNKRKQAPYIIVIADHEARFDPHTRVFTRGKTVIADVEPVLVFAQDAYILRRP